MSPEVHQMWPNNSFNFRCTTLIARCLQQSHLASDRPLEFDAPEKDYLIVALDLLSGLAEGLGEHIESMVGSSQLVGLVYQCSLVKFIIMSFSSPSSPSL